MRILPGRCLNFTASVKGTQVEEGDYTNYTEDDIKEATRVLTGWMIDETFSFLDPDTGSAHRERCEASMAGDGAEAVELATEHDPGVKTFTG